MANQMWGEIHWKYTQHRNLNKNEELEGMERRNSRMAKRKHKGETFYSFFFFEFFSNFLFSLFFSLYPSISHITFILFFSCS